MTPIGLIPVQAILAGASPDRTLPGAAGSRSAVNPRPKSVVQEICTLRSVGGGGRRLPPPTRWALSNGRPYRDRQVQPSTHVAPGLSKNTPLLLDESNYIRLRRRIRPKPSKALPSRAKLAGSGMGTKLAILRIGIGCQAARPGNGPKVLSTIA